MESLRFYWLGSPQITMAGQQVRTDRRKAVALLAYLTLETGAQRREKLAALFWPDFDTSSSNTYLRRTLWEIKQMLGQGWLVATREEVYLNKTPELWVDVAELINIHDQSTSRQSANPVDVDTLQQAVELYRGDFMAGFSLRDSLEFDAWQQQQMQSLRQKFCELLKILVITNRDLGNKQKAIEYALRWAGLDPLDETAQRALMESYALAGQRSAALRQYDHFVELLREELGVKPEQETQHLLEKIRSGGVASAVSQPSRDYEEPSHIAPLPLPIYPTAFVGRQTEMQEIANLVFDPGCRFVTLLGPGGSGKTRLAVEVGQQYANKFKNGVAFVSLAAIREIESILPAIGRAFNLSYHTKSGETIWYRDSQTQLFDYLREKQLLLITDNWEHLIEGCTLLSELLAAAPGLKILATSREKLNLPEEWVYDVRGLSYPSSVKNDGLESYSAYQLFIQSARRMVGSFAPDVNQKSCIVELCQLLDGLPLGIELAASWVRLLECGEIVAEIRRNISFLETSMRGIPARHRSLRAVFDHTWGLLNSTEQEIMMRLSVFRGGFSRDLAEKIAGASIDQLATLLDKSLITHDAGGRYGMHEVLKQFSAQRLEEDEDHYLKIRDTHATYFLDWLVTARNLSTGARQRVILQQFDHEIENIGAACLWAVERNWWSQLIQGLPVLFLFHDSSTRYRSSAEILSSSVDMVRSIYETQPDDEQVLTVFILLLSLYSHSLLELNQIDAHSKLAAESYKLIQSMASSEYKAWAITFIAYGYFLHDRLEVINNIKVTYELFEKYGDRRGMAIALGEWAGMLDQKEYKTASEEAKTKLNQAIKWMEELNDLWTRARLLSNLARVHNFHGEYQQAREYLLEALSIFEELGENWPVVDVRFDLGQNALWLGEYDQAEDYFSSSLEFLRNMGTGPYYGAHLDCLGYIEYIRKNYDKAETYYEESLGVYQRSQYVSGMAMVYNNLGDINRIQGFLEPAIEDYQKGIRILPEDGEYWTRSILIKNLGNAMLESGDLIQAEKNLRKAQRYALLVERIPDILEIDFLGAKLFAMRGDLIKAIEILSMINNHSACTQIVRENAQGLLEELCAELVESEVSKALESGLQLHPGCAFGQEDNKK